MRKDWLARELTMEIIVGVFIVMVFLGLGYFTIILSRETWFSDKRQIEIVFDDVMGLSEGDSVVARGMPVGKVKRLALCENGVCVSATLDYPLSMRRDYRITIIATSILGGRYLDVFEGTPGAPELGAVDRYRGQKPYDLMGDAAEVVNAIKKGLVEEGGIDDLRAAAADMRAIIGRVNAGQGTLGKLVSEDDTLYSDLSAGIASLRTITARLEEGRGTLGKLLAEDDAVYDDVAATVKSLRAVADRLEKGEGLLGRLMQDDTLYTEIEETVREVRASIDDMRETSPVVLFTSVFFGAF
jgi:phospholipid/cholesterol/gamma-HCH transport system substrate-binding protein